jgi:hypothetical protein
MQNGLKPFCEPVLSTATNPVNGNQIVGWPYICLGTTPSAAWGLSGDMDWVSEVEEWDLWQVNLAENDEVHIRPDFGWDVKEVRVHNAIGSDRVWWVATRTSPVAREAPKQRKRTTRKKA